MPDLKLPDPIQNSPASLPNNHTAQNHNPTIASSTILTACVDETVQQVVSQSSPPRICTSEPNRRKLNHAIDSPSCKTLNPQVSPNSIHPITGSDDPKNSGEVHTGKKVGVIGNHVVDPVGEQLQMNEATTEDHSHNQLGQVPGESFTAPVLVPGTLQKHHKLQATTAGPIAPQSNANDVMDAAIALADSSAALKNTNNSKFDVLAEKISKAPATNDATLLLMGLMQCLLPLLLLI